VLVESGGDDGVLDEKVKGDDFEGVLMGGFEEDGAGGSGSLDCEPAVGTDAPAVAGFESWETVLRHGGDEVVAQCTRGFEKGLIDDAADGVNAVVVGTGVAAAVAVEAGDGLVGADFEGLTEDVAGGSFDGSLGWHRPILIGWKISTTDCGDKNG